MKYTYGLSDKLIAYLTLISGLVISAVAVWYSVAGLVSIFAASAVSIIIMGVALEVSKLVATVWLKWNWKRAPRMIKTYLISAIAILMLITSMGIFGYLSKAHLDQSLVSGDVVDKVAFLDEKIKTERENIEAAKKALAQMDAQVDQVLGRTDDARGAERAVQIRRNQQAERTRLQNDISKSQAAIAKLNEERAPIAKDLRAVEAEVGPIKYIAKLIYGDNPDANILEKAVTWVIIIIVLVFDPLAVVLLLSSQYSFQWFRQEKDEQELTTETEEKIEDDLAEEANNKIAEIEKETDIEATLASIEEAKEEVKEEIEKATSIEGVTIEQWNQMISEAEKAVEVEKELEDHEILESAHDTEKEAMRRWKEDHPEGSLKQQRRLFERGAITKLPWEDYLKAQADFTEDDEAAEEAAKWAAEQLEAKKKGRELDGERSGTTNQESSKGLDSYKQNAEQSDRTLWQRIQDSKK